MALGILPNDYCIEIFNRSLCSEMLSSLFRRTQRDNGEITLRNVNASGCAKESYVIFCTPVNFEIILIAKYISQQIERARTHNGFDRNIMRSVEVRFSQSCRVKTYHLITNYGMATREEMREEIHSMCGGGISFYVMSFA